MTNHSAMKVNTDLGALPLPLLPDPKSSQVVRSFQARDHTGANINLPLIDEQAWTLYLDRLEIVTMMTIGDWPILLGLGYLRNQELLNKHDPNNQGSGVERQHITSVDVDHELRVIVVRTSTPDQSPALSRRMRTSGCGEGTMFEHVMQGLCDVTLSPQVILAQSVMMSTINAIQKLPSLYLHAGAIHGCVLCQGGRIVAYLEDIGRHNAIDKIAGLMWLNHLRSRDHWLFTTGRLTTEMVIKALQMRIPILVSRSGFTAAAVDLARQAGLTLVGRAKGARFTVLSGETRLVADHVVPLHRKAKSKEES